MPSILLWGIIVLIGNIQCSTVKGDPNIIYLAENETNCVSSFRAYEIKISNVSPDDNLIFDIYYNSHLNYVVIPSDFDKNNIFRIKYSDPSYLIVCTTAFTASNYTYKVKFYSSPQTNYDWMAYMIIAWIILIPIILVLCIISVAINKCCFE